MKMISRRNFLGLSLSLGFFAGCSKPAAKGPLALGPISKISEGRTSLDIFRVQIIRNGPVFRAISLLCTHQTCLLAPREEGFDCPCHNSQFDMQGRKLSGPAPADLPWYELSLSPEGNLMLHRDKKVGPEWSLNVS